MEDKYTKIIRRQCMEIALHRSNAMNPKIIRSNHGVDFRFMRLYRGYENYLKFQETLGRTERMTYKEYCQRVNELDHEECVFRQIGNIQYGGHYV